MKTVRVSDRTRLMADLSGPQDAPPVLLLDGIACDGFAWRYLSQQLREDFRLLHVQYRGHGRSGYPRDMRRVSIPRLARDVIEAADVVGVTAPAVCFGHSMGVQVLLEMALRYPKRVRAGVLMNGPYERPLDTFKGTDLGYRFLPRLRELVGEYGQLVRSALGTILPTEIGFRIATFTEMNPTRARREDVMPYLEHAAKMPLDLFMTLATDMAERTSAHYLARVTQPMLVVAGENDGFTPPFTSFALKDALPDAEHALLFGGTHAAPIEMPGELWRVVDRFLESRHLRQPPAEPEAATPAWADRWRHRSKAA